MKNRRKNGVLDGLHQKSYVFVDTIFFIVSVDGKWIMGSLIGSFISWFIIDHFFSTMPNSICRAACSRMDSSACLYFNPNSLMLLELSSLNLRPRKLSVLMEGKCPLFLMPSASMGLEGILYLSPYLLRRRSKISVLRMLNPEIMYRLPLAYLCSRAFTWATATSRTSTNEFSKAGVGTPG